MSYVKKLMNVKIQNSNITDPEKNKIQHNLGKMTSRERIYELFDEGSFIEIGTLISKNAAGVIVGYGTVNGNLVYVYSQDYTVDGGAIGKENSKKICKVMDMAAKMGAPLVQIFDSSGGKLLEGLDILKSYSEILKRNARNSGVIPQIVLVMGPCEGIASLSATMSDFVIMKKENSSLCVTPYHKIIEGEKSFVENKIYANADENNKNGNSHFIAENEKEAFKVTKKILRYLPSNNMENSPLSQEDKNLNVKKERLNVIAESVNKNIYEIIHLISDDESFLELSENWEKSVITGLCKVNGLTVGVIATNSDVNGGILNIKSIEKLTRFIKMCDGFNIPIASLVDTKGFESSLNEEKNGLALYCSKLIYSLSDATVPKISIILGEASGATYIALASKEVSFDICYAWPCAKVSLKNPEQVIKSIYKNEIVLSDNPKKEEERIINEHLEEVSSPYKAAEMDCLDDIIIPSETKQRLFSALDMLQSKREIRYPKKHGSILV